MLPPSHVGLSMLLSVCSDHGLEHLHLRKLRDGTVFVRAFVRLYVTLAPFSSLWSAFTLTVHINALYNESVHRQKPHTSGIDMIP